MKRTIVFFVSLVLIVSLFGGLSLAENKGKVYNLRMQTYYSPTTYHIVKQFAEQVGKMSDGRLKITVFAGGELVSSTNILQAVKSGTCDLGQVAGSYFSEFKMGSIQTGLPYSWTKSSDILLIHDVLGLTDLLRKDYAKHGVYFLGPVLGDGYCMLSKVPVTTIEELKKIKVRASGATAKLLNKLGVSTVYLPPEDMYVALSTGQVDAVIYGSAMIYSILKYYEQAEYYNITPFVNPIMDGVIINQKLWDSLPADLKAILETGMLKLQWAFFTWSLGEEMKHRNTTFKGKTVSFTPEAQAVLLKAATEIWDEEAKKSPECAQAVEMIKELNRLEGRLQ